MKRAASCVAGLLVACAVMLEGARSNGAEDWLAGHDDALSGETNPDSLFNLCARLFKRLEPGGRLPKRYVPKDVRDVQDEILAAARRLHLLVMPLTASKDATAAAARGNEETKVRRTLALSLSSSRVLKRQKAPLGLLNWFFLESSVGGRYVMSLFHPRCPHTIARALSYVPFSAGRVLRTRTSLAPKAAAVSSLLEPRPRPLPLRPLPPRRRTTTSARWRKATRRTTPSSRRGAC
jgi:hypothetical protein